jgi:hypothetical protein
MDINTKEIRIGNWKLKKHEYSHDGELYLEFKHTDSLNRFYSKVRELAYITNFGGNEYEKNSFSKIRLEDGYIITISAPRCINGDNNWYSYSKDTKKECNAYIETC